MTTKRSRAELTAATRFCRVAHEASEREESAGGNASIMITFSNQPII
jgi:hypothetical protein